MVLSECHAMGTQVICNGFGFGQRDYFMGSKVEGGRKLAGAGRNIFNNCRDE